MSYTSTPHIFESSVETAVGRSVQQRIPLVVFISDDSNESQTWITDLLETEEVERTIGQYSVPLRLVNGSTEAGYFAQIFPIANVPSLYIVNNGVVVDYIAGSIDLNAFTDRLQKALIPTSASSAIESSGSHSTLQPTSFSHPESVSPESNLTQDVAGSSSDIPQTVRTDPDAPSTTSTVRLSVEEQLEERKAQIENKIQAEKEKKKQPLQVKHIETGPTANKYQEQLRRKRLQESEERQRILKLLQDDREERKSRSHRDDSASASRPSSSTSPNPDIRAHKRTASADINHHNDSALAIRLFDGSTIKNRFPRLATLGDVRQWIDANRTDGDAPYSILSQFPHKVFSASDENETLVALELHPTATLILKPISNFSSAYNPTVSVGRVQSGLQSGMTWAWGALGTFLGLGYTEPAGSDEDYYTSADRDPAGVNAGTPDGSRTRTMRDLQDTDRERRTYNGNQLNLEDDI
ncbi:ubiquitin-related domain-containing protein [Lipomyces tetrasporus]|uniref:UBX domain-containing protein 2 n=1 Tax=Lipomyces tetrasporus TaxID=54092 RepID=A0AAD7QS47_9ASCO|nr:ubiquitin-related domain-containing protein [Lipomyces tetrasporus]KAJ8100350.1 ubiquitin-related domain-containing protein [Lipomyces tetrasporus]